MRYQVEFKLAARDDLRRIYKYLADNDFDVSIADEIERAIYGKL